MRSKTSDAAVVHGLRSLWYCCWKLLIWLEGTYGAAAGKVAVLSNRGGAVDVVRKPTAADSMNGGGEAKTSSAMAVTDRGAEDSGINE
ncbi:hypothetical protein NC651_006457 [Populus alba x Populus x berolinensis]|nr:hypothetical protein NC651_006457 [Populus alba x Populus x berolinensis]